ncbi:MAG: zinc-ribbon domain-containing protein, partial [Vulcanimicrobiaceae bacterium]
MYTDETLTCTDCGAPFVFTAGEAQFFATKGFQNKPSHCADCRAVRKA